MKGFTYSKRRKCGYGGFYLCTQPVTLQAVVDQIDYIRMATRVSSGRSPFECLPVTSKKSERVYGRAYRVYLRLAVIEMESRM